MDINQRFEQMNRRPRPVSCISNQDVDGSQTVFEFAAGTFQVCSDGGCT